RLATAVFASGRSVAAAAVTADTIDGGAAGPAASVTGATFPEIFFSAGSAAAGGAAATVPSGVAVRVGLVLSERSGAATGGFTGGTLAGRASVTAGAAVAVDMAGAEIGGAATGKVFWATA